MGEWKKTQCSMCGLSCGLEMEVGDEKIISVRPDPDSPRTHGYCCRKGRAAKFFQDNSERLDYPLKRVGDNFERISWEQAYKEIGEKAAAILKEHGPRSLAVLGCALGSAQAECAAAKPLLQAAGSQYMYNPIGIEFGGNWWSHGKILGDQFHFLEPDDGGAEVLIFWGSNAYVSHQLLNSSQTIREYSENPDKMVIAVDPRLSETARMADMHIMPRPGTDSLLLRAMIALILRNKWQNQSYIDRWVGDFERIKPWFEDFDIEEALKVCRVPQKQIEEFCRVLVTRRWGMHQDLGLFCGRHSTLNSYLAITLMTVCGMTLVPGGNVVMESFTSRENMFHKEDPKTWRTVETGRFPVLGVYPVGVIPAEILSDKPEHLRMMFTSLGNPVRSYPDSKAMEEALKHLELLVSIDISMTETAKLADYVLPGKTSYESYDFNVFPLSYPEIVCQLKHPALGQVGERKEDSEIWTGLAEAMGLLPKLPERLYRAAERAVHTSDRIPYFMKLLTYAAVHPKQCNILPLIVAKTLGKYMGSANRAIMWAALISSPLAGSGLVEASDIRPGGRHKIMEKLPKLKERCLMDAVFQAVDEHPEGCVIGRSDPEHLLERHIAHKDRKIHLYCDEINEYIKRITPEREEAELSGNAEFPMILSAGRHSEDGCDTTMRNPGTYKYRGPYAAAINPEDAAELGISDGALLQVTTKTGSLRIPAALTWQTARGYVRIPRHFGLDFEGKTYGAGVKALTSAEDFDALTGNPIYRYVPCRVEAAKEAE